MDKQATLRYFNTYMYLINSLSENTTIVEQNLYLGFEHLDVKGKEMFNA